MSTTIHNANVLFIFGACGLDRLLTVARYPLPDEKVRTLAVVEVGGGNAANVAHTTAALGSTATNDTSSNHLNHTELSSSSPVVTTMLGTKVGSDAVGYALRQELQTVGVQVQHPLFVRVPNTTTSVTTVIVCNQQHTRTCFHSPGSCGETWTTDQIIQQSSAGTTAPIDWSKVRHFHSDARHTDAALLLMQQAKAQPHYISISLDVEKDRHSQALDEMLILADIIFTNALQLKDYLHRLTAEWETAQGLQALPPPVILRSSSSSTTTTPTDLSQEMMQTLVRALEPSTYFARRYQQTGKQIVITKGQQGSIHIVCDSIHITTTTEPTEQTDHHDASSVAPTSPKIFHSIQMESIHENGDAVYRFHQVVWETDAMDRPMTKMEATYTLRAVGVLPNVSIVDTTGAGDAFLGGYLVAQLDPRQRYPAISDRLRLGAWVAGHKLQGSGARTTLPTQAVLESELGIHHPAVTLRNMITQFGENCL